MMSPKIWYTFALPPGPVSTGLDGAAPGLYATHLELGYLLARQNAHVPPNECPENIKNSASSK